MFSFVQAYGCVAYLRIEITDGNLTDSLFGSKTRVTPLDEDFGIKMSSELNEFLSCLTVVGYINVKC